MVMVRGKNIPLNVEIGDDLHRMNMEDLCPLSLAIL